jgi:hypothetical protein
VFLDVVASWLHLTVTIAVSRAWAFSTLKQRSWMSHVLITEKKKYKQEKGT